MKKTKQELINSYSDKDTNHLEPLKHIFTNQQCIWVAHQILNIQLKRL